MWAELLAEAEDRLARAAAVESPASDARWIVEAVAGRRLQELTGPAGEPVGARAAARLDALVERRCAGEPLQYVVGSWGFRSLDLMVDPRVLIPRPETETTAGCAIVESRKRLSPRSQGSSEVVVADLGTGSGAIALAVAVECPQARVHATDVSEDALAVATANLAGIGVAGARVTLHAGDWFNALPARLRRSLDVVVCNPPYVARGERLPAVVARWEPSLALWSGDDGNEASDTVVAGVGEWLAPRGALVMEINSDRAARAQQRAQAAGLEPRIVKDLAGRDRVLVAVAP